ncbi:MarR family winged helix-turn-helix transcriptional regulator [Clostridium senegalense]|uniref:MarR family winged helix-turn-helix transcriptional regulator n=1 Tax=Clostridium senegalense TaxID=1465809 RepID=UPI001C0FFC3D|nr:MarR family transcriptional regulator [Clostridium senegalense]MBU5226674.1 MarR family transcriptional regulator [Clostridium senegalense]
MSSPSRNTHKLNEILVEIFNDILKIEEKSLSNGPINDLSITEIHTIDAIGMYDEKTMSEVAQELKITVGTLTTAINKLVKKEYVNRSRCEKDRRSVKISLTNKGKLVYRIHQKFHTDMIGSTIEGLTKEEELLLISSLDKVNKFFKEKYKDL